MEEALDVVNSLPKPLAAYLFTKNKKFERQVVASISAGGMVINDTTLHVCFKFNSFLTLSSCIAAFLFCIDLDIANSRV